MKRVLFSLVFVLVGILQMLAGPVDFVQAQKNAAAFLQKSGRSVDAEDAVIKSNKKVGDVAPAYYVFNAEGENGFVIVSGDDRTNPILGYTDSGSFDATNLPDNFRAWLQGYGEQIASLGDDVETPATRSASRTTPHDPAWAAIAPLLKTTWNQYAPYNNLCPEVDGQKTLSGCVATAVAQIMYYHGWPNEVTTTIPSYTTDAGLFVEELQPAVFEWHNMPLSDNGADVNNAVARLMRYVGQSVKMGYGTGASGAFSEDVPVALADYFGYDKGARSVSRFSCGLSEWHELIYEELSNDRPVYYSGSAPDVGHAFVCDGYDGNGYYHINWGWGGSSNGYFLIEILNPNGTGAGGSASDEGYSGYQRIIVGLQPDRDGTTEYPQTGLCLTGDCWLDGMTIDARFDNHTHLKTSFEFGFGIDNGDGTFNVIYNAWVENIPLGWGVSATYQITSAAPFNQPGTYRVVPVSREWDKGVAWNLATSADRYVEVVVDADLNITATLHPSPAFSVTNYSFSGEMYAWVEKNMNLAIENKGDEFYGKVYLLTSKTADKGTALTSAIVASMPNSTIDVTIPCNFPESGNWNLALATDENGNNVFWQGSVEVQDFFTAGQYLFENFQYNHYLSAAASKGMVGSQKAGKRSVWDVQFVEGGITLQNVETGLYAHAGESISAGWTLQPEPQVLQLYGEDGGRIGTLTFGTGETYFKMHEDRAGNIVNWCSQEGTSWKFTPYTPDMDEELARVEADLIKADLAATPTVDDIADALGSYYNMADITLKDFVVDGHVYRHFAGKYYRFTNRKQKKNLGINASGIPAGGERTNKDVSQIWQLVPAEGGFVLCNPNLEAAGKKSYLGRMSTGSPAPAARMQLIKRAQVYNIVPGSRGFYLAASSEEGDYINMEGEGFASGDFVLTKGDANALFTADEVKDIEVDLQNFGTEKSYATVYLPFDVTNASADVRMYVGGAIENNMIELVEAESVKALGGFVLEADAAKTVVSLGIGASDAALESTLKGTVASLALSDANRENYLLLGLGGASNQLGFYAASGDVSNIPANTAYIDNAERLYSAGVSIDNGITGLESIEQIHGNAAFYDLSGRRITDAKKGIYISGGKKFIVK